MKDLTGKVAIVTGGARDIGRAISVKLAELGAAVVVNYRANHKEAEETLAEIHCRGGHGMLAQADATKAAELSRVVATACELSASTGGGRKIDILVNNAGGLVGRRTVEEMAESFWDEVLALNLKSVFLATKAVLPHLPDGAAIVNLASQAARDGGGPGASAYAAAKAGVLNFTRSLAKELAPRRIRANAVAPGMIATRFHDTFTKPEVRARVAAATPLGREGCAAEVAEAVAFLASERASFVNGESLEINGGIFLS